MVGFLKPTSAGCEGYLYHTVHPSIQALSSFHAPPVLLQQSGKIQFDVSGGLECGQAGCRKWGSTAHFHVGWRGERPPPLRSRCFKWQISRRIGFKWHFGGCDLLKHAVNM